jgi:hypothetical protein
VQVVAQEVEVVEVVEEEEEEEALGPKSIFCFVNRGQDNKY